MYSHTKFGDPTWTSIGVTFWKPLFLKWDNRSKCMPQWPNFGRRHTTFPICTQTPSLVILHEKVQEMMLQKHCGHMHAQKLAPSKWGYDIIKMGVRHHQSGGMTSSKWRYDIIKVGIWHISTKTCDEYHIYWHLPVWQTECKCI